MDFCAEFQSSDIADPADPVILFSLEASYPLARPSMGMKDTTSKLGHDTARAVGELIG